jgi:exodeoxyribonuclease V gamma subunit
MLRAVHSNRVESLLAALLEVLPPADPFAPATIVVGSHLVSRWLTQRLALERGIASGLELPTFDRFVERTWAGDEAARGAGLTRLDRSELAAAIASVLAEPGIVGGLPAVAAYLEAAPAPGDRAGPRRVQLAEHLAGLYWNYALSRPDWMPAFVTGHVPSELAGDPTAHWQAALLGAALRHLDPTKQWAPTPLLPWLRRRAGLAAPRVQPVAVFGLSFLARAQLEALTDLATTSDVSVYILDPCEELWDDVAGRQATTIDPLPLVLWGRPVRDTLAALVERTGGDLDGRFAAVPPETARDRMLADVRTRSAPAGAATGDAGVTVLACPNPRREIEVIAAAARHRLDDDPTLGAHEIGVWVAGDHERYLAQAPAAFEAVGVPCHLVDAPIDDRGRIGEALLALLELPTSGMARRDLLRVMTHPAVLASYAHVDAADWVRWTERLGIVHGADGEAHRDTYLADHPGHFHWDQGVRRLALGAFMVGDRAQRGAAKIASFDVAPEELRPDQQASAATYALVVRSLCSDAGWLASLDAPLTTWAEVFAGLVDEYLAARDDDAKRDLERVRAMLAGLARLDLDGRPVGFREAREHATRLLESARANRGEPLAAGVMVAPLAAMRAVPFRIVFVAGLDEGAFPAGDQPSPLDLRREHRPGDVSPRDRDRAAFLDVMLGAREALYLSYVAVEPKSGQTLGPSSVILELADALAPYVGAASSRDALATITVRQPLHRFGDAAPSVLPAVDQERWGCAVRDALRAHLRAHGHPIPDEDGLFSLVAHPAQAELRAALAIVEAPARTTAGASRSLNLTAVRGFLEYPLQAWAQAVLDLDELPDDAAIEHSDEPFHLGPGDRATLLREVFAAQLRDPSATVEARYDAEVKQRQLRGQFPVGVFAEAARIRDLDVLDRWRAAVGLVPVGGVTRFGFGRASAAGAELVPALELELAPGRTVRLVGQTELLVRGAPMTSIVPLARALDKKSKYHLRGAIDHLVLAAAGLATAGHAHKLIDVDGLVSEVHHAPWSQRDARAYLAGLVTELLDHPHGYLLPFDAAVKALANARPSLRTSGDVRGVIGYGPIDRRDGLDLPDDARAIAVRRLAPLLERLSGEHGFEVVR